MFYAIGDTDKINVCNPNDNSDAVMFDSEKYPKHPFKVGWINDEYDIDSTIQDAVGKGLDHIFNTPSWIRSGDYAPSFYPDWKKSYNRAISLYKKFKKTSNTCNKEFILQALLIIIETINYVLSSGRSEKFDLLCLDGI